LMVVAVAAPASHAQAGTSWPCDAYGYLFQTQASATTSQIMQVDLATGVQNDTGLDTPDTVNAVGYNQVDGYFYGYSGSLTLVRIHSDGTVDDLGVPPGMDPLSGNHIGDVDANGHYWVSNGTTWFEVDLTTPTPTVLQSGTLTFPPTVATGGIADWVWTGGGLYSIANPLVAGAAAHLVRFNPATGALVDLGPVGFPDGGVGAVFADASGYLYASQNATNNVYRIDTGTRQTILAAPGTGTSPGNDGARCARAPVPTITVTKTVNGRVRPADQFTVGLLRPNGSTADTATTAGTGTTASTVNFPASQGQTYTITDAMAAGSPTPFGEYVKSIACTDADGNPVATGGSVGRWTLVVAATTYTCNVTNSAAADVVLEKSAAPSPVVPGEDVTFSLKVTNNGPSTAVAQSITDDLPDEVTFSSASPGCNEASGTVTCAAGDLAAGASQTFTITARVASSLNECLRNTATTAGSTFDPNTSNNSSTICTPIEGRSNIAITKAASAATVSPGGQVMYTLVVRNNGPSDDPGVLVSDPLNAGLALVSAQPSQGTCTTTNNVVACDLGALRDGGSAQVLVTANVTATSGCIPNTARVQGSHEDPNADNNQASAQVCVEPPVDPRFDLAVSKRASSGRVVVGQRVTYTIVVTNNGPDAAPNAKITDTFNKPATLVSVSTPQGTCTERIPITCELGTIAARASVRITVVIKPRVSGRARNAASATGDGTDTTPDNNIDTVDKTVRKVPLRISKVAASTSVQAGGTVNYRIRVSNPSKGEARNVKVCDRPASGMSFVSSTPKAKRSRGQRCWTIKSLKAGKSRTFRVTMRMADGANGRKVNRATVNGADAKAATARRPIQVRGVATPVTG
jgi:uncharacterized repeat protein (TIGR01451 family)